MPKNLKLQVTDLALELTRRCNMACEHCLRGDAEPMDMPAVLIQNVFRNIASVQTLTFTGGEPSLVPELIKQALDAAIANDVQVSQVYVVTNAKQITDEFVDILRQWHVKCVSDAFGIGKYNAVRHVDAEKALDLLKMSHSADDPVGVHIAVSADRFHEDIPLQSVLRLSAMPNIHDDKSYDPEDDSWILNTGRAQWNGLCDNPVEHLRPYAYGETAGTLLEGLEPDEDGMIVYDNMLYVSATGSLFKYCDYSYDQMDENEEWSIGSINAEKPDPDWVQRLYEAHKDD